jgi:hypothetical protein
MTPTAYVSHQIAGRVRLRVPDKRGDSDYFEMVRQRLAAQGSLERMQISPQTGSILIHHAGSVGPILAAATEHDLFRMADQTRTTRSPPILHQTSGAGRTALANGLSGLALLQVARGHALGSAVENFWHAYGSKRFLQRPALAGLFLTIGIYQVLNGRYLGSATSLLFYAMVTRQLASSERDQSAPGRGAPASRSETFAQPSARRGELVFPKKA